MLGQGNPQSGPGQKGAGGKEGGGTELLLEFKVDEIIDWLWEDLKLPNLQPRVGPSEDSDWQREGWDRRGARSRLDRRRSFKESVKRRAKDASSPAFTDEDLRFRQLKRRRQPYLVLEHIEGRSLREVISACGRLPVPTAVDVAEVARERVVAWHPVADDRSIVGD